jgi:succinate-semialdehyde dehydrogenase/glutarate-semialdehyde dehydrogenase
MTTTASPEIRIEDRDGPQPGDWVRRLPSLVDSDGTEPPLRDLAPATGALLAEVPVCSDDDVRAASRRARAAQIDWAATPVRERARILLRFHDLVLARRQEGLDVAQWETGKARKDAAEELLDIPATVRYYARSAARLLRSQSHRGGFPLLIAVKEHHHPKGVVSIIAPWNYPLTLAATDAAPALLAGNTVVLKPDSQTPLSALWVLELLREAGLPRDVMQVVVGAGSRLGPIMIGDGDYLMFTGSTATGRLLAAQCGQALIDCSMELGGKNSVIVRADADIRKAAEVAVRACFSNSGQLCISTERLLVHESIKDEFLAEFLDRVRALTLSPQVGWGAQMGSLISADQLATVQEHVADAVAKGATVLAGGQARPDLGPFCYEPTVLAGVTEEMVSCHEETFGPVVAVSSFSTDDKAVELANDTGYGLNAAILTTDPGAARAMAARIRTGTVNINEGYGAAWLSHRAPMGGMGISGIGRRHGPGGLLKYTEPQTVATMRALGFGPQFGMSDEQWVNALAMGFALVKKAGLA